MGAPPRRGLHDALVSLQVHGSLGPTCKRFIRVAQVPRSVYSKSLPGRQWPDLVHCVLCVVIKKARRASSCAPAPKLKQTTILAGVGSLTPPRFVVPSPSRSRTAPWSAPALCRAASLNPDHSPPPSPHALALPPTEMLPRPVHRRKTTQRSTRPLSSGLTARRVSGLRARRRVVTTSSSTSSTSATTRRASAPSSTRETRSTTTLAITTGDRPLST